MEKEEEENMRCMKCGCKKVIGILGMAYCPNGHYIVRNRKMIVTQPVSISWDVTGKMMRVG